MTFERGLQVKLQERYRRVAKAEQNVYHRELGYLRDFVRASPRLRAVVELLERTADPDPEEWVRVNFGRRSYDWPPSEVGRAGVAWHLVKTLSAGDFNTVFQFAFEVTGRSKIDEAFSELSESIVEPLVQYLQEALGTESDVLYTLARYRRRFEWFDRERLLAEYERDTTRGEAVYDEDLRRFLFDEGIDYPFSQPASASGKADIIAGVDDDDPLVSDVKLFDGGSRGVPYLSAGLRQVVQYAHDYGKTVGYLVVVNLTGDDLELPTDDPSRAWPPRLDIAGVTVFLIVLRAKPKATASKQGRAAPRKITRQKLVSEIPE